MYSIFIKTVPIYFLCINVKIEDNFKNLILFIKLFYLKTVFLLKTFNIKLTKKDYLKIYKFKYKFNNYKILLKIYWKKIK